MMRVLKEPASQEPNPTRSNFLTFNSKRQLMILPLHVLLSNKKRLDDCAHARNGIKNEKLKVIKVINWNFKIHEDVRKK